MKKFCLILTLCFAFCNNAYAKKGVSSTDVIENLYEITVGETYNLYLNRKKYPSLDKLIQQLSESFIQEGLLYLQQDSDNDLKEATAYALYEMDIHKERALFYQKVDEKKIRTTDNYVPAFLSFLILHSLAIASDEDFNDLLRHHYQKLYQTTKKNMGIAIMTDSYSYSRNINQNIYVQ